MSKDKNQNEKKIKLDEQRLKSEFQAPKGYFEGLDAQINQLIDAEESKDTLAKSDKKAKLVSINRSWYYSAAALVAACALIVFWFFPLQDEANATEDLLSEVTTEDIIDYLVYSEINTEDIIQELANHEVSFEEELPDLELSNEEADALLDYYTL